MRKEPLARQTLPKCAVKPLTSAVGRFRQAGESCPPENVEDFWRAWAAFWDAETEGHEESNPYARLVRDATQTGEWPIWWDPDEEARATQNQR